MTPLFLTLSRDSQCSVLEALIFASDEPLTEKLLYKVLILEEGVVSVESAPVEREQLSLPLESGLPQESDSLEEQPFEQQNNTSDSQKLSEHSDHQTTRKKLSPTLPDSKALAIMVKQLVQDINDSLAVTERPYRIVMVSGGYQFATIPQFGEVVARLVKNRTKRRLSQAALEVLAIVAYKQPITKPEIEAIRGVNSGEVMNSLVEKELVTISGRSESVGKPLLYSTTDEFLKTFGLHSVSDLPKLRELDELFQSKAQELASGMDFSIKTSPADIIETVHSMIENEAILSANSASTLDQNSENTSALGIENSESEQAASSELSHQTYNHDIVSE